MKGEPVLVFFCARNLLRNMAERYGPKAKKVKAVLLNFSFLWTIQNLVINYELNIKMKRKILN
jgi:hypothetical protein